MCHLRRDFEQRQVDSSSHDGTKVVTGISMAKAFTASPGSIELFCTDVRSTLLL